MGDPRVERYAELLVARCVDVQPGWQVLVISTPLGRPLVDEVVRQIARRGAYAILRLEFNLPRHESVWTSEAPEDLVARLPEIEAYQYGHIDAFVLIDAPENAREGLDTPPERVALLARARRPLLDAFVSGKKPWVGCQFPTQALAQDAGMTLKQFEKFVYGAVLVDWESLAQRMLSLARRFEAARDVRIVGDGTDLALSLDGRRVQVDALGRNMPGGEFFCSPVEDSANGVITFSEYPACHRGHVVPGVRLRFEAGRVVEASADGDEEFLLAMLDVDVGARRLGELGIGCNPGIRQHTKNTLFDEKIEGTIHVAIGFGFEYLGGRNVSAVHWDMVKDLRRGGRLELDGEVVQENGRWLVDG